MAVELQGKLSAEGKSFGIVLTRFNSFVGERLLTGALDTLTRLGADESKITVARAPGAFELPLVAAKMLKSGKYDGVLALGCLIKGQTPHFDFIAAAVTKQLEALSCESLTPVGLGVITSDTLEQAIDRAGGKAGNKGSETASAVVEMVALMSQLG